MGAEPGPQRYPHLFSPLKLGDVELANRFVVPALTTNYGNRDGTVSDALCDYLAERARGGFGLVTTENIGVHSGGRVMPMMIMAHEDRFVPGLAQLAAAIKAAGVPAFGQLSHPGRQTKSSISGAELVAPSAIPCPINKEMPRALQLDEIADMEQAFIAAAVRLREAGFDGIEIHAGHGYLLAEFLSRYSNHRDDAYGGPLVNRMRFLANIIEGIRDRLGAGFPLVVRISGCEFVKDGIDVPEAIEIGTALAALGVHALSVSVGVYESFNRLSMVSGEPEGQWLELAGSVRAAVPIPVIGVGRLVRATVAEAGLAEGKIDLAAFGRASMADPALPNKVRDGREEQIMLCIGCNLCLGRSARPMSICPVNPAIGREAEFRFVNDRARLRLAIIGGSFAALTAAWVAAARGHAVSLFLDGAAPGGLMHLRAGVPGQEVVGEAVEALLGRALRAGVRLEAGRTSKTAFDAVWATRSFRPHMRDTPGVGDAASPALDVLANPDEAAAAKRAVVIGDDLCSAEAAIVLARRGVEVTVLSPAPDIAFDAHPGFRDVARRALASAGASVVCRAAAPFDAPATETRLKQADLIVIGRDAAAGWDDEAFWPAETPAIPATGYLRDAYEPGLLTRAVYEAVEMAVALGAATGADWRPGTTGYELEE